MRYLLALGLRNLLWKNDDQDQIISEVLLLIVTSVNLDVPTYLVKTCERHTLPLSEDESCKWASNNQCPLSSPFLKEMFPMQNRQDLSSNSQR